MIRIVKASAGSGKTFRLTQAYLGLLLRSRDPQEYRHILAVTFTNKATGEMKSRILKELDKLARTPEASGYHDDFVPGVFPDDHALSQAARQRLGAILHDYSGFSVSTIDRFFQQTLKAFSREIGHFASYQVELDKPALVRESVDRIMDSLTDDKDHKSLIDWLIGSVRDGLSRGERFRLDEHLYEIAESLESESYRELVRSAGLDEKTLYSHEHLSALIGACRQIVRDFNEELARSAGAVLELLQQRGIPSNELGVSTKKILELAETRPGAKVERPSDAFFAACDDPKKWFLAKTAGRNLSAVGGDMEPLLSALTGLFRDGKRYIVYRTALVIRGQLFALGITGEIRRALTELQQEKNVLSLDDSNDLLREIIDGSDAPFIYEKIGVRYRHFLLDEFQDTSIVQWNNFLPLLRESLASGGEDLVVGDVKQSIYRFRDSDWRLLDREIGVEFSGNRSHEETLGSNHRTQPLIVSTCGDFFRFAADQLDRLHKGEKGIIRRLYRDVIQVPKTRKAAFGEGLVEAAFCAEKEEEFEEILRQVRAYAGDEPGRYGEIAILVRGNKEGSEIAGRLIAEGIPVISDDALFVKSSVTVRRLVSQLALMLAPEEEIPRSEPWNDGKTAVADSSLPENRHRRKQSVSGYMARKMGFAPPQDYQSPLELAECLLRGLQHGDEALFDGEIAYIQAFMDYLSEWSSRNGNDLAAFLEHWKEADPRISPPEEGRAVRIMTIHKSKGLEFPLVILPFVENIELFKPGDLWCLPEVQGTQLEGLAQGAYQVRISEKSTETLFSADYTRELLMQMIDNLNILYVAMTRPQCALSLIAQQPKAALISELPGPDGWKEYFKTLRKDKEKNSGPLAPWDNMRDLLFGYIRSGARPFSEEVTGEDDNLVRHFRLGTAVDRAWFEKKAEDAELIPAPYPSYPLNDGEDQAFDENGDPLPCGERGRLKFNSGAADYFGEDGSVGIDASPRVRGTVLHGILSRVVTPEDLPGAVRESVVKGELPPAQEEDTLHLLSDAIAALDGRYREEWFPRADAGCEVLNEVSVISTGGDVFRPDRVVIHPGGRVWIVDYKFGHPDGREVRGYLRQIGRYASLLRSMGYSGVSAALWYPLASPESGIIEAR